MICPCLVLSCLLLGGCLRGGSSYVPSGASYSAYTLARYGNSTSCDCPPANPFAKGYVQTTNPFGKGYVQDTNPFGKGYIQDKCLIGLDD